MKKNIIITLILLLIALLLYYVMLPPINLSSPLFWFYVIILIFSYVILSSLKNNIFNKNLFFKLNKVEISFLIAIPSIITLIIMINFILSPIFNAKNYSKRINVIEGYSFVEDVKPVDFTKIPLIDKESSEKLGDRKMGEFTSMVSQFYVSNLYTQINYNNEIVRVTPLEYASIIKYFANRDEGIKGYIIVNSVDGSSSLKTLENGMRYMPSALFFENLYRKLRISYPTLIFDKESFEIDNDGNPYWIIPTIKYIGVGLKKEINGAVILDPITGKSKKYKLEDIPTWVDHVFSADLIIEEVDNWGEYRNGFLNSIFAQKDVINTTDGYNYLVMDDDVYLYTGITSVSSDESNLGFILANLRTKETKYYLAPGAEEFSAMASAEGLVQEKSYDASFPLLINLNNRPTYLLSLKDAAGLVKMYAFIDVADYQKVVVSEASYGIENAASKYLKDSDFTDGKLLTKEIILKNITSAVIDGNTYYYLTDSENNFYYTSIIVNKTLLPFLKVNDKIKITYKEGDISEITNIEK